MPHSDALESHAHEKATKIQTLFKHSRADHPLFVELFLNAQTSHTTHHTVECNLKIDHLRLSTHDQGSDMYTVIDRTIDKMVAMVKKEKAKMDDRKHRVMTEKAAFSS